MGLVLYENVLRKLTVEEADGNFKYLDSKIDNIGGFFQGGVSSQVLQYQLSGWVRTSVLRDSVNEEVFNIGQRTLHNSSGNVVLRFSGDIIESDRVNMFMGDIDASGNPNYPSAKRGHRYRITASGKVGGGGGKPVASGMEIMAVADNTGGDEATVGSSWVALGGNVTDGNKGHITVSGGGGMWTINNNVINSNHIIDGTITLGKLDYIVSHSVLGNPTASVGFVQQIAAGTDGHVLRRRFNSVGFGLITGDGIETGSVPFNKLLLATGASVLGVSSSFSADYVSPIAANADGRLLARVSGSVNFYTPNDVELVDFTTSQQNITGNKRFSNLRIASNTAIYDANGAPLIKAPAVVAGATRYIRVENAIDGSHPAIRATNDSGAGDVGIRIIAQGGGDGGIQLYIMGGSTYVASFGGSIVHHVGTVHNNSVRYNWTIVYTPSSNTTINLQGHTYVFFNPSAPVDNLTLRMPNTQNGHVIYFKCLNNPITGINHVDFNYNFSTINTPLTSLNINECAKYIFRSGFGWERITLD